jgi:hypothetical protein
MVAAAVAAAAAQFKLGCFHWTGALYVMLRAAGARVTIATAANGGRRTTPPHLQLWSIFLCCCGHNWLMAHRSDLISPHYLKLWLRVIPGYRTLPEYHAHFGHPATANAVAYPEELSGA